MKKLLALLLIVSVGIVMMPRFVVAAPTHLTSTSIDEQWPTGNANNDNAFDSGSTGSDRILIVVVSWRNSAAHTINDSAVSYANASATPFGVQVESGQAVTKAYYLLNPATGSNTLRVYTSSGAGAQETAIVSAFVFTDVDQTTPYDGYTSSTGTDDSAELTVTSAVGDTPFFAFTWRGGGGTSIAPTNYTERADNLDNNSILVGAGEGTGAASVAFTGTVTGEFSNNGWSAVGMNLNAAAGGGGATVLIDQPVIAWIDED